MCRYINPLTLKRFGHFLFLLTAFVYLLFRASLLYQQPRLHSFFILLIVLYREDNYSSVLICTQNTQVVLAHYFSTWRILPHLLGNGDPREGNRFMFPGLMRDEGQQDGIVAHHGMAIRPAGVDESRNDIPSQTS